jgi:hypothetical protein
MILELRTSFSLSYRGLPVAPSSVTNSVTLRTITILAANSWFRRAEGASLSVA